MNPIDIKQRLESRIPDAAIDIIDLRADGRVLSLTVVSASFLGKNRIDCHRDVYRALGPDYDYERGTMPALHITTKAA